MAVLCGDVTVKAVVAFGLALVAVVAEAWQTLRQWAAVFFSRLASGPPRPSPEPSPLPQPGWPLHPPPPPGLPSDFHPLFAEGSSAFATAGEMLVGHGGRSVREVIVPFVEAMRA